MKHPDEILGDPLWAKTRETFRRWVAQDWFSEYGPNSEPPPLPGSISTIAELVGVVLRGQSNGALFNGPERARCSLQTSLRELMRLTAHSEGEAHRVSALFHAALCMNPLLHLLWHVSGQADGSTAATPNHPGWEGSGCADFNDLSARVFTGDNLGSLASALFDVLLEEAGDRPLGSFFEAPVDSLGYRTPAPSMFTGSGSALPDHEHATGHGVVKVQVNRCLDASDQGIRVYEWHAALWAQGERVTPLAAACGMVYVLKRRAGKSLNSAFDLKYAADTEADADFLQVHAFLTQHGDAESRMDAGDLCFLWLWERHPEAAKGAGTALLAAALQDLKKRFAGLRTLVANARPAQFHARASEYEPPEVQVARQEAMENLERLFDREAPQKHLRGELRLISMRAHITRQELTRAIYADGA